MRRYWRRLSPREKYLAIAIAIPLGLAIASGIAAELMDLFHVKAAYALGCAYLYFVLWLEFIRPERWSR